MINEVLRRHLGEVKPFLGVVVFILDFIVPLLGAH
jgi:hypothetical protein